MTTDEMLVRALVIFAEHGVEPDMQELLVYGNETRGVRPGALPRVLSILTAPEAKSEVAGWVVLRKRGDGIFMSAETYDEASAAAEADIHDRGYFAVIRVRSALVDPEGGV